MHARGGGGGASPGSLYRDYLLVIGQKGGLSH